MRLRSRRGGRAALDQVIVAPRAPFTVLVRGRVISGRAELALEWTTAAGEELGGEVRELDLPGAAPERFASPPGAERLRVIVVQTEAKSILELDAVELRSGGDQLLENPDLALQGCPTNNTQPAPPYAVPRVPGWSSPSAATFEVVRPLRGPSPPVVIRSERAHAALVQYVEALRRPFTIRVVGEPGPPGSSLLLEWRTADAPDSPSVFEERRPLLLRGGEQVFTVRPPPSARPLVLGVGLAQDVTGSSTERPLTLDRVELVTGSGEKRLRNPGLDVPLCAPAPMRPIAASVWPPTVRWGLTLAILIALVLAFGWLMLRWSRRERARPVEAISRRTRIAFLVAIALTPLVSVGTVKFGLRIVIADWLFLGLALVLLSSRGTRSLAISDRTRAVTLAAAAALLVVTVASLVVSHLTYTDANLSGLNARDRLLEFSADPLSRGLLDSLRLAQGIACLFVVLALVNTRRRWIVAARVFAITGAAAAVYGIYQVVSQEVFGSVLQPPGAFSNPGILRASGPFSEPQALGGFLVVAAACAVALHELEPSWWVRVAAVIIVAGVILTQSSSAIIALALLALAMTLMLRPRGVALVLVPLVALALAAQFGGAAPRVEDAIRKPLGDSNSVIDREVSWTAAAEMGAIYAPIGVGRGQFAYNQAPFVEPDDAGRNGRVGSAALEIWAESGPVGAALALLIILASPVALLVRRLRGQSPDGAQVAAVVALAVAVSAVMITYFSTTLVWPWVVIGLMAAAPRALSTRSEPGRAPRSLSSTVRGPTSATPEPSPATPEPSPATPEPTPATPEPTPATPEPATSSDVGAIASPIAPAPPSTRAPSERRVLHVMRMKGVYGAERHLLELTAALRPHGWASDVLILAPQPDQMFDFASELAQVCGRVTVVPMRSDLSPALIRRLARELRSGRYSVAHSHMVHADWHLAAASPAASRVVLVSSKHNHDPFRRRGVVRLVEHITARPFAQVISISDSLRAYTRETAGVTGVTVRYGLAAPDAAPRRRNRPPSNSLLSVGRLEPQKGFDVLLRAMAIVRGHLPRARLAIAGEGGERQALERLIVTLGLEGNVKLLGRREDIPELMRAADALVHPARWEGFGLVLLEAMREGLPVIATRVGAIPEVVDDGVTGWLVPPNDAEALAASIVELLQSPKAGAGAGEAGFARLKVRFSPDRMAEETAAVYRAALPRGRGSGP